MVKACASGAADSGLIASRAKPITSKFIFTASCFGAQHERGNVENKLENLLIAPFEMALSGVFRS